MKITMKNCQGIADCVLDIPQNSIVEFVGPNSNGKSTLSRFIKHICQCDFHVAANRKTLIMRGQDQAEFIMESDRNTALIVIINKELQKSYMAFTSDIAKQEAMVVRQVSDRDACFKLIHRFGFRTYSKGDLCLNLAPTYGAIPLVNTSGKTNYEIIDDFSKDTTADEFLTSYKTYTRPMFSRKMKILKERRGELERKTAKNLYPDWQFCKEFVERNTALYNAISLCTPLDPIDYMRPIAYHAVVMQPINYRRPHANIYLPMVDMLTELREVIEYNNKRCPTCGRQYLED